MRAMMKIVMQHHLYKTFAGLLVFSIVADTIEGKKYGKTRNVLLLLTLSLILKTLELIASTIFETKRRPQQPGAGTAPPKPAVAPPKKPRLSTLQKQANASSSSSSLYSPGKKNPERATWEALLVEFNKLYDQGMQDILRLPNRTEPEALYERYRQKVEALKTSSSLPANISTLNSILSDMREKNEQYQAIVAGLHRFKLGSI